MDEMYWIGFDSGKEVISNLELKNYIEILENRIERYEKENKIIRKYVEQRKIDSQALKKEMINFIENLLIENKNKLRITKDK